MFLFFSTDRTETLAVCLHTTRWWSSFIFRRMCFCVKEQAVTASGGGGGFLSSPVRVPEALSVGLAAVDKAAAVNMSPATPNTKVSPLIVPLSFEYDRLEGCGRTSAFCLSWVGEVHAGSVFFLSSLPRPFIFYCPNFRRHPVRDVM